MIKTNNKCRVADRSLKKNSIRILADLCRAKRELSVTKIAERNNLSWKTVNDHIEKLEDRKLVACDRSKRRTYCKASSEVLKELQGN